MKGSAWPCRAKTGSPKPILMRRFPKSRTRSELLLPFDSIGVAARYNAGILRQLTGNRKFRELRHRGFVNALYEVERAAIPFADEPPIVYPDPEFWERISIAREKYKSMDLLGSGTPEKRIYDALDQETILEFNESPLSEVVDFIKNAREIPIVIDQRALDDVGMGSDTPVTISLAGITLRSALKIMLKELDLTYVISDEVLKITTPEEAENELLTKVYPVADLVLPIISGGGMGGMMGGGMGGMGMGGMGGGMGGMGGGMGGMGMGGHGHGRDGWHVCGRRRPQAGCRCRLRKARDCRRKSGCRRVAGGFRDDREADRANYPRTQGWPVVRGSVG